MFPLLESVWNLLRNPCNTTHLTLGMLLHYLGKLKIQIVCRYSADMEENANKLHFECAGHLPIVRWSDREHLFVRKACKVSGRLREVLNFWSRSLARFMRAAQFASVSSCARRLLKHFRCKSLQIIRNTDGRWIPVSRDISRTVLWVCSLSSWLKTKSLTVSTFSSVRALRGLLLTGRLSTVPVSRNFFQQLVNATLCPAFLRKFVCQPLCCVPIQMQMFFIKILLLLLNTMLIVDKHCSDVSVMRRISGATN